MSDDGNWEARLATAIREAWRAGYMAGFDNTGEGWNGEYPFDQWRNSPKRATELAEAIKYRDKQMAGAWAAYQKDRATA